MKGDVLYHDDGIVDHESYGCGQAAQRHQIEALAQQLQCDERHQHSDGNHQRRHGRGFPVAEKQHHDDRCQDQPDQNRIARALDGLQHDLRLIVERLHLDSRWQAPANAFDLGVHFVGDGHGVGVRLPADVEQHRRLAVRAHDRVNRLHTRRDPRHIRDANRHTVRRCLDGRFPTCAGSVTCPSTSARYNSMALRQQSWRINQIGAAHRVEDVAGP